MTSGISIVQQNQSVTYLMVEDTKEILNERANFVSLAIILLVNFLQVSNHVHNLDKSLLKNFLLFLQCIDEVVDIINGALRVDTVNAVLEDGLGFIIAEKYLTSDQ